MLRDRPVRAGNRAPGPPRPRRSAAARGRGRCVEFITGPLLATPQRVGSPLGAEVSGIYSARLGRNWRVLYEIDDTKRAVIVLDIQPRSVAHRPR